MKKSIPLLAALVLLIVVGLYSLNHWREVREQQRQQVAHMLARCVNEGLLSLFRLQANDWRSNPDYYREQGAELERRADALSQKLLEGEPFEEWREATRLCGVLTAHSNNQHRIIFQPLGRFASLDMTDPRIFNGARALKQRKRIIGRMRTAAQAAHTYLEDLRTDIHRQVSTGSLDSETVRAVEAAINSEVLDNYREGNFSVPQVSAHLERVDEYFRLLAENPRGLTVRGGGLFFYDGELRRKVEQLNRAIMLGGATFLANWTQIVQHQQAPREN